MLATRVLQHHIILKAKFKFESIDVLKKTNTLNKIKSNTNTQNEINLLKKLFDSNQKTLVQTDSNSNSRL